MKLSLVPHCPLYCRAGPFAVLRPLGALFPRLFLSLFLFVSLSSLLATAAMAEAEQKRPDTRSCFHKFESAWARGDASGVAACMAGQGKLKVFLRVPDASSGLTGWDASQARRGLGRYFSKKVTSMRLVDVTKKEKHGTSVRLYDYHYRIRGGEQQVTRLTVTLTKQKSGWVLDRIQESFRPATPRRMIGTHQSLGSASAAGRVR